MGFCTVVAKHQSTSIF